MRAFEITGIPLRKCVHDNLFGGGTRSKRTNGARGRSFGRLVAYIHGTSGAFPSLSSSSCFYNLTFVETHTICLPSHASQFRLIPNDLTHTHALSLTATSRSVASDLVTRDRVRSLVIMEPVKAGLSVYVYKVCTVYVARAKSDSI